MFGDLVSLDEDDIYPRLEWCLVLSESILHRSGEGLDLALGDVVGEVVDIGDDFDLDEDYSLTILCDDVDLSPSHDSIAVKYMSSLLLESVCSDLFATVAEGFCCASSRTWSIARS